MNPIDPLRALWRQRRSDLIKMSLAGPAPRLLAASMQIGPRLQRRRAPAAVVARLQLRAAQLRRAAPEYARAMSTALVAARPPGPGRPATATINTTTRKPR